MTRDHGLRVPLLTIALVALSLSASGVSELLQYDRRAVAEGQAWLLLTGQLVHWTPRMAATDLLVLFLAGAWVEMRSRRLAVVAYALSFAASALAVQLASGGVELYRGSSGVASALFTVTCLTIQAEPGRPAWIRGTATVGLLLLVARSVWELAGGSAVAAGRLPEGVSVTPAVHVAGVLAGAAAYFFHRPR